jgi:hypothetical protein
VNKDHEALYIFGVKIFMSCANTRDSSAAPTPQYTVVLTALAIIVLLDYGARLKRIVFALTGNWAALFLRPFFKLPVTVTATTAG